MRLSPAIIGLCAVMLFLPAATTAGADQIADWKTLAAFHEAFTPYLSESSGTHDDQFVTGWTEWRAKFGPFSSKFKETYGSTRESLQKAFDGVEAPDGIYVYPFQLVDLLTLDLDAKQKQIASWLKKDGDGFFDRWNAMKDPPKDKMELKADYALRALTKYRQANQLDPGTVKESLAEAEKAFEESNAALKRVMRDLKWPGHNPNFQGPGNPDTLAAEALKLLRDMNAKGRQWSRPEYDDVHIPIAACVTGSRWEVAKKAPLTETPTQYSLQFLVAFKGSIDPDIAYAYTMHFYTDEKAGIKMEPPFFYCNSAQYAKYKMLMANVVPSGAPSGSGSRSMILRVTLALLLILGGLAVWNKPLRSKLPRLAGFCDTLAQKKQGLGLALAVIGLLSLLRNTLFFFSPLADLLPQLAAMAAGLSMASMQTLQAKVNNATVKSALLKIEAVGSVLAPHEELLGKLALAIGLVHLLAGGVALL